MAFQVLEPIEKLEKQQAWQPIKEIRKEVPRIVENISVRKDQAINFLIVWTAVSLYYFFSGLTMLIRGKLPRGWTHFEKKKLIDLISNVEDMTQRRREMRKYGKVYDLDKPASKTRLI